MYFLTPTAIKTVSKVTKKLVSSCHVEAGLATKR